MSEAQTVLDLLTAQFPWLLKLATAMGLARMLMKPLGNWLKGAITRAWETAINSKATWDDHWIECVLDWPLYRAFVFLLDYAASVKLPTREDLTINKPNP